MRIKKQYETIVNLDSVETYMANLDDIVLEKLRRMFEGKCFKSSLVLQISRIIRRSMARPAQNLADGSSNVNVVFEAEAIIYNEDDIITNCEVKNVERSGGLICEIEYASIHIRGNIMLRGVLIGQIIPVRVKTIRYSKGKDKISINAVPYFGAMEFFLYQTDTAKLPPQEDIEFLTSLIATAEEEMERFNNIEKTLREFFTETFYAFKEDAAKFDKAKLPPSFTKMNALEEAKKLIAADPKKESKPAITFAIRHPKTDKTTPNMFHIDPSLFKGKMPTIDLLDRKLYKIMVVAESYSQILINYLEDHIEYLRMIQDLSVTFGEEEKRRKHKNIWAIYNRLKH